MWSLLCSSSIFENRYEHITCWTAGVLLFLWILNAVERSGDLVVHITSDPLIKAFFGAPPVVVIRLYPLCVSQTNLLLQTKLMEMSTMRTMMITLEKAQILTTARVSWCIPLVGWMDLVVGADGVKHCYGKPHVFLYCCTPEKFPEEKKT